MTNPDPTNAQRPGYVVLRCRIGVRLPCERDKEAFESALAQVIASTAVDMGAAIDLLQLAAAIDPSWALAGPPNRC